MSAATLAFLLALAAFAVFGAVLLMALLPIVLRAVQISAVLP